MASKNDGSPANGGNSTGSGTSASVPALSLPKGGGAIRGIGEKFAANPVTGTGAMSVPIATSPGRVGFGPQLALAYDSGAGNGPFGFGWHLSLPSITRKTDLGLPRYQDSSAGTTLPESDVFILSGSEDLVPVFKRNGNGDWVRGADGNLVIEEQERDGYRIRRYRPRIEGLFARIERWIRQSDGDTYWRAISKDNVTTFYGKSGGSRIADPDDPTRVFSWLISQSHDDKGNAVVYDYVAEDDKNTDPSHVNERNRVRTANRYLKRVKYGNRAPNRDVHWQATDPTQLPGSTWMFELLFDYGEGHHSEQGPDSEGHEFITAQLDAPQGEHWLARQDPFSAYRAGFEVRTYRLCRRALMFHHFPEELGIADCLVRSTEFTYDESPIASFITSIANSGYVRQPVPDAPNRYLKKSFPATEFTYSKMPDATQLAQLPVENVDASSLENLPYGMDGSHYQWVDLDGEGISGILTEQANAWFYKRNLSPINEQGKNGEGRVTARLARIEVVPVMPNASLSRGEAHFADLAGDGLPDLVTFAGPMPGFYEHDEAVGWKPFHPFRSQPNVDTRNSNLKFVDLDGDGHADILIGEGDALRWHPSMAEDGFGPAIRVSLPLEEERGPRWVFDDGTQSFYLADMSGDGLSDLVRIRNGEVCYWPNLGYGRFGAKVTMDNAPRFEAPDLFDQRRVRLADIDGSGVADIIYLAREAVCLYFNRSGNSWSQPHKLPQFPGIDGVSSVSALDLLGNGTTCLVWSSPLPSDARRAMRYIDLMQGQKPHLLIKTVNNLGAETVMQYVPTTKIYLQDKRNGKPWITKLPFPVHVVERVETYDRISRNRFVTRYTYHHGYFDGAEREFRGFGLVEQMDTEEFAALNESLEFPSATNIDQASHVPPVLTRTWFHTGVHLGRAHISDYFAGLLDESDIGEYYREPGLDDAQARQLLLDDTVLPDGLTGEEEREACRALKGSMLRQEVYALDGTEREKHPYTVAEQNFTIRLVQPQGVNRNAMFFTHVREAISYHYERDPEDPRTTHALTLAVDEFGNILKSAAIAYGRRQPDPTLEVRDQAKQRERLTTYTENDFTNSVDAADDCRIPLAFDSRTYELTGLVLPATRSRFTLDDVLNAGTGSAPLPYEQQPTTDALQKRLIEHVRTLYRCDDLTAPLPLGQVQPLALPFETLSLAFTPGLISGVYAGRVTDSTLENEGGYVHSGGDANWWIPSGRAFFSPDPHDAPPQELAQARAHFFLPRRYQDPFGTNLVMDYDGPSDPTAPRYDLLPTRTLDPLGNQAQAQNDYRVLQPRVLTDPNHNRASVVFDALGMVVGTAIMGKPGDNDGDSLENFDADLTDAVVAAHLEEPFGEPHSLLGRATTRLVYDLFAYRRTKEQLEPQSAVVYTLARETHDTDLAPGEKTRVQHSFAYSDGFGREIEKKIQAELGPVVENGPDVSPRWLGSGWTVFDNKGNPVRQYEPFFSATHRLEFARTVGVSPILFYDPVERIVATLQPNHTYSKGVFDPWRNETWDVNDTVLQSDPKDDAEAGDFFRRLPDPEYLPTWHTQREAGALGTQEQAAAFKTAVHANTPKVTHLDTLGRPFLTSEHNRSEQNGATIEDKFLTRVELDIEGNQRAVIDPNARVVMRYDYDMLGNRIHLASMEAGERWVLNDVAGKTIYEWDSRGHQFRTVHDSLRRLSESYLREGNGQELQVGRTVYGETQPNPEVHNLRGKVVQLFDQAGVVTNQAYDFKGNLLRSDRQLAREYKTTLDWSLSPGLEPEPFTTSTSYDALNRLTELTTPDDSVFHPSYNEASLLERLNVNLRGAAVATSFVADVDYNAKGQRTLIDYANGARTTYEYDALTYRLTHLETRRGAEALQNIHYTYDPVGNISLVHDEAQQTVFFRNKRVEPSADYTYDANYRLIKATGREHLGQIGGAPIPHSHNDTPRVGLLHPGDGDAMGTYIENYIYDAVGNILSMRHRGRDPAQPGWTRDYAYDEPSLIESGKRSNRLTHTTIGTQNGQPVVESYTHDAHGNMTEMPHLSFMQWDYLDQLQATARQVVNSGSPETTHYAYAASGQRLRKVTERQASAGQTPTRKAERIYLDGLEIYREYENDGDTVKLVRETLHVTDDMERIALVETRTQGNDPAPQQLIRYQFSNHLGSASLELDDQGQIISYEEYFPYGSTSYQAVRSQTETPKCYGYTGKERDKETGLSYHGARYCAPWLGRWLSCDPSGLKDGVDLYVYVGSNPITYTDPTGNDRRKMTLAQMQRRLKEIDAEIATTKEKLAYYEAKEAKAKAELKALQTAQAGVQRKLEAAKADYALKREAANQATQRYLEAAEQAKKSAARVTRLGGGFKVVGGGGGFAAGATLCATIIGCIIGGPLMAASADVAGSGASEVYSGEPEPTFLGQVLGSDAQKFQEDTVNAAGLANPAAQGYSAWRFGKPVPPTLPPPVASAGGAADDAARALQNLGVVGDELATWQSAGQAWGNIARGQAQIKPYFKLEGDRLTAGILGAFSHADEVSQDMIKAFLTFKRESNALAKASGAKTIRWEASTVINQKEVPRYLAKMGYKEMDDTPFSYFLETPVK